MEITQLRTNQITNPLGFEFGRVNLSWVTAAGDSLSVSQKAAQVEVSLESNFSAVLFDSGVQEEINSLGYSLDLELKPRTRYYWRVTVWGDAGDSVTSDTAWFETAKMDEKWQGKWISPDLDKEIHPLIRKEFMLPTGIVSARVYLSGLGIYDLQINGKRVSDEYFAPGFNAYDHWIQYQTYDVTDLVSEGNNAIGVMLGNGWYKGRFGFDGGHHELYGSEFAVIGEIFVTLEDGSTVVIGSDESWKCTSSPITFSGIYDGEIYDANLEIPNWSHADMDDSSWTGVTLTAVKTDKFLARLSLPVKIKEVRKPVDIITTPAGETVLDMGQIMTGWVTFKTNAPKGTTLQLQYGEILQNDCFYRDNLRTAKAEYTYISDGSERVVQPYFTFFGFRYVKLTGFDKAINLEDFTGCVIYSDINQTGHIETSNPLVNQLFSNALWGQKGNFLDVPTDCPQRDERMGWTGDAQVFASTACYNMYSPAFYNKFMFDLREEQKRLGGSVPFIVPQIKPKDDPGFVTGHGSTAWGDAATVIPWVLYKHYGDKELLDLQFDTMKDWVDYIKKVDEETGGKRLWQDGFHFGDWLALDGPDPLSPMGGTDAHYIASAYYCYSAQLVAKAASVLGKTEVAEEYTTLANEIKEAIKSEYFSPNGRIKIHTQTAMIVALYMDLIPDNFRIRVITDLKAKLRADKMHLKTGFVGTPYFCHVLSENGANEDAYTLLLNEDFPSWLFAVKLGATTIWERWNSVLADRSISDTGMNSLNHYAYGSIAEWMYTQMCGINPVENAPGYRKIVFNPKPYGKLSYAKAKLHSASGLIESGWEIHKNGKLSFAFKVPFNSTAEFILPDAVIDKVIVNGQPLIRSEIKAVQEDDHVKGELIAGTYQIEYIPAKDYILKYSSNNSIRELLSNEETEEILAELLPDVISNQIILHRFAESSLRELSHSPLGAKVVTTEQLEKLDEKLSFVHV